MRQPGIYYNPEVHDWGSKVVQGGLAGLAMVQRGQAIQANKMKMDEAKKMQAVKDEISAAFKESMGDTKAPEAVSGAEAGFEPTQAGMAQAAEQGAQAEGQGLAGMLAQQQQNETKVKPLVAKAQFMTKAKEIFEKHGMVDQAMAIEKNYMSHVAHIGHYVSKKAALQELRTGMFAESFKDVTLDDIDEKKGTWHVTFKNGNTMKYNDKTGETTVEKGTYEEEEKDTMGGQTGLRHFKKDGFDITEEYDKESKTWNVKGKTPIKDPNATSKKDEAKKEWTKADVRQEYNNMNTYINKVEDDLAKRLENEGENANLTVQIEKIRNVRQNLMKYRSDDEWSVSDAKSSERGKYPRNLQKISDYLSGFGGAAPKNDITQMKPTTGGKKERKALADIL